MAYILFQSFALEIVAQASPIDFLNSLSSVSSIVHLIDGTIALMVLLLSAHMALTSLICGGSVLEIWGGGLLITIDFIIQLLISRGDSDKVLEGTIRDLILLAFGFIAGENMKKGILKFLLFLFLLAFPIYSWGWNGVVERCAGHCFYLK